MLDDLSGVCRVKESSMEEYVIHIRDLRETLGYAWRNNRRVEALNVSEGLLYLISFLTISADDRDD